MTEARSTNSTSNELIDLRTDAVTRPTDEMWEAMRNAEVGWSAAGEDPYVNDLEAFAAELTGKETALYVPTGSMTNLVALMTHTERGDQIILEASSHILWSEEWSLGYVCGVVPRAIEGKLGHMDPDLIRASIVDRRFSHRPRTRLICLENTHNAAGGTVINAAAIADVVEVASEYDVPVHMDGARLFNACAALDTDIRELTAGVDSLMVSLGKGLSAPGGALLCGDRTIVQKARTNLKRLGGHSVKAGAHAAAGLVALKTMIPRLREDNRRAWQLATKLAKLEGIYVDFETIQTNIVMVTIERDGMSAHALADKLATCGIKAYPYLINVLRFVTHRHITDEDIERVVKEVSDILCHERHSYV